MRLLFTAMALAAATIAAPLLAQENPARTLFTNVHVFDGTNEARIENANVLVEGNLIKTVSTDAISAEGATVIDGAGRTLMPGLSDCHWHILQSNIVNTDLLTKDFQYITLAMALGAERVLMNGVTTVRDMGGPVFGLKQMIDEGRMPGPRIFPSGAFISQTSGHADFRFPNVVARAEGRELIDPEILGYTSIADGVDAVRRRARENLMKGASQLKVMAGGGVATFSDPLDVAQYSVDELKAAVEEASNWNTYITVHAYTAKAVQHALSAGIRSIEHGQMMDEETAQMIKEADAWVCMQPFLKDQDAIPLEPGSFSAQKYELLLAGVDQAYGFAKQYDLKVGFGTDTQNNPAAIDRQTAQIPKLTNWYTPFEALRMATSGNQELFRMSGPRHPYQEGPLGVIAEGAYADILLVDGNPLENINLLDDPRANFDIIMKDGVIYKNALE
ncbi:MAG: amidohydrolase family protein [Myxococcales bacterium]|nr:amidohydrolase family protein [Myxococcales bacterium]